MFNCMEKILNLKANVSLLMLVESSDFYLRCLGSTTCELGNSVLFTIF